MKKYMTNIDRIEQRILHKGVRTTVYNDRVRFPSGAEGDYVHVSRQASVAVAAVFTEGGDNRTILVEQYRYPIAGHVLQFPMGFIEEGNTPEAQASAELREETGYKASRLAKIGRYYHDPGLNSQMTTVFVAGVIGSPEQQNLDDTESITVRTVPISALEAMIKSGQIRDALTITIVYLLESYLREQNV